MPCVLVQKKHSLLLIDSSAYLDRVGGRTYLQTLKCADEAGNDDNHSWEMGGMWVGT